jgi:WD40 repeat protein
VVSAVLLGCGPAENSRGENKPAEPEFLDSKLDAQAWASIAAFAPDGKRVLVGYRLLGPVRAYWLKLWDVTTGTCLRWLPGHQQQVTFIGFTPDGRVLTGGRDGLLNLYQVDSGELIRSVRAYGSDVGQGALSGDGKVAFTQGREDSQPADILKVWDVASVQCTKVLGNESPLVKLAVSPDGARGLTGTWSSNREAHGAKLWDLKAGKVTCSFEGKDGWMGPVAFSPDGRLVVLGRLPEEPHDPHLVLWNLKAEKLAANLQDWWATKGLAFTRDGRRVFAADEEYIVRIWDVGSGKQVKWERVGPGAFGELLPLQQRQGPTKEPRAVTAFALSPDGAFALVATHGHLSLWDVLGSKEVRRWVDPTGCD